MEQAEVGARELRTPLQSTAGVTTVQATPPGVTQGDAEARDLVEKSLEIARLEAQAGTGSAA